jgi:phosphoribosyl-AMP cyclohydrolase / phosphoribosyl-ATP pyrophosphohydrolase
LIIPSIDIQNGQTVQLIGGKDLALDAGDPRPIATTFGRVGEIAVIDLDAAMGKGSNAELIDSVLPLARCRVGGGIRSVEAARRWLDAGAAKVILGTAARPEILSQLPRERVIAALDAVDGEVVVDGWVTHTGASIVDRMAELAPLVGGFLVTFVEREGRMQGTDMGRVRELVSCAGDARLTVAGGVTTASELAELHALGVDAQVGMALYTGRLPLHEAVAASLHSDRQDGLWPTVVVDPHGVALGLCWSNAESLEAALETGRGVYWSRRRGLWRKGETSGATQALLAVDLDCDSDALRFTVRQEAPGFCHEDTHTCWGPEAGLPALARRLAARLHAAPSGSYTRRLLEDPALLRKKLLEEAGELADAQGHEDIAWETADVIYFALVAMARGGATLEQVERVLDDRALKITRRPGDAKC